MNSGCNFKTAVRFRPPPLTLNKLNMPNMSYCRFENTARAMADCISAIEDNDVSENLSIYEVNGLKDMQMMALDLVNLENEIEDLLTKSRVLHNTN